QNNQFIDAVSAIPGIVHQYMDQQMKEAVQEAVQIQTDRLQDSLQRENDEFLRNIDENMKKVLKGLVKISTDEGTGSRLGVSDVPSDDSDEELSWNSSDDEDVDEQTKGREESEGDKTDESDDGSDDGNDDDNDETVKAGSERDKDNDDNDDEEELAKNDDEDTESGKGGDEVYENEQRNLYKALVEAYDADKTILDTYGESTILKRRQEDHDQEGPSAGSDRGSKRQREGWEHASASTPSETATGSAGRSTTGSQSRQLSASESAFAKEPVQTTCQMEEP
nr:hypothetical protein [Tanacetum cinerariifolium]